MVTRPAAARVARVVIVATPRSSKAVESHHRLSPGGVLWIDPTLVQTTDITRSDLPEDARAAVAGNKEFGSEAAATRFVVTLQAIVDDQAEATSTTTTSTSTTTTTKPKATTTTTAPVTTTTAAP